MTPQSQLQIDPELLSVWKSSSSKPKPSKTADKFQPDNSTWSLDRLPQIQADYQKQFNKPLPLVNKGQGSIHNKWGYDHRNAADVSLNPSTPEGQRFSEYLRQQNVPFLAFDRAVPGVATGPHYHLGAPSKKTGQKYSVGAQQKPAKQPNIDPDLLQVWKSSQKTDTPQIPDVPVKTIDKPRVVKKSEGWGKGTIGQGVSSAPVSATGSGVSSRYGRASGEVAVPTSGMGDVRIAEQRDIDRSRPVGGTSQGDVRMAEARERTQPGRGMAAVRMSEQRDKERERPTSGMGGLHVLDDPQTARILEAQRQVTSEQSPFEKRMGLEPGAEESKTTSLRRTENEAVLQRMTAGDESAKQAAWEQENKTEIDSQIAQYRQQIRDTGFTKWLTEAQAKGAAQLAEFGAGGLEMVGAHQTANNLRIRAVAAAQAAQEEGKGRTEASKFAQDILGGFAGSAPELLLMQAGVPPIAAFGGGAGLRAKGMDRPVGPAVTQGVLTGAAFEIPAEASGIGGTLARAGKVGLGTTGVDLATGQPVKQAIRSGITNAAMASAPGLIEEAGKAPPEVGPPKASIAPVIADARAERIQTNLQGAQPAEVTAAPPGTAEAVKLGGAQGRLKTLPQADNAIVPGTAPAEPLRVERPDTEGAKLNRWQHRDFGAVTESANQLGVGKGRVRVLAEDGTEHVIQRPTGTGAGNQIAIPVRKPIDAKTEDAQGEAERTAPFKVIDKRGQNEEAETKADSAVATVSARTASAEPQTTNIDTGKPGARTNEPSALPQREEQKSSIPVATSTPEVSVLPRADTATEISKALNFAGDRHFVAKFLESSPLKAKVLAAIPEGSVLAGPDARMPERQSGAIRLRAPDGTTWEVDTGDAHKGDSDWKQIGRYTDGFAVRKTGVFHPKQILDPYAPPAPPVPEGKPETWLHGTDRSNVEQFSTKGAGKNGGEFGDAVYLTNAPDYAKKFGANIVPAEVSQDLRVVDERDIPHQLYGKEARQWATDNSYEAIRSHKGQFGGKETWQLAIFKPEKVTPREGKRSQSAPEQPVSDTTQGAPAEGATETAGRSVPDFVRKSQEALDTIAARKASGIKLMHAGADPYELYHQVVVKGWELYDQKLRPTFEEWSRKLKDEFGPQANEHIKSVWAQLTGSQSNDHDTSTTPATTGIAQRVEESRRSTMGREAARTGEGISAQDSVERGRQLLSEGKRPEQAVSDFKRTGTISSDSVALVRARHEELARAANKAFDDGGHKLTDPKFQAAEKARQDWWEKAVKPMQTEWHKTGMAQQGETAIDTGTFYGLYRAFKDTVGKEPTSQQSQAMRVLSTKVAATETSVRSTTSQLVEELDRATGIKDLHPDVQKAVKRFVDESQREVRTQKRQATKKTLDEEAALIKTNLVAAFQKIKNQPGIQPSGLARLDPEGEITKLIVKYAANRVKAGVADVAQLVDDVHGFVKDFTDVTKREVAEAISGFGATSAKTEPGGFAKARKEIRKELKAEDIEKTRQDTIVDLSSRLNKGSKTTPDDGQFIWSHMRDYIDRGEDFRNARTKTATDLGIKPDQVTSALTQTPKAKRITDDLYRQMAQRRAARSRAESWVKDVNTPIELKALKGIRDAMFNIRVAGGIHGTVGPVTHAGKNLFMPSHWANYFPNIVRTWKAVVNSGYYERAMQDLEDNPNYIPGKRAGLANDPHVFYDEYQNTQLQKFLGAGNRGFGVLKIMRQDFFDSQWNALADSQKTPEMAKEIAAWANHATGAVKTKALSGEAGRSILFAGPLEASRWAWLVGDNAKALWTLRNWGKASESQKWFAKQQGKDVGQFIATYGAALALNQGLLIAVGSKDRVNFTDPQKGAWLRMKIGGRAIEPTGGIISAIDFVGRLGGNLFGKKRPMETRFEAVSKTLGGHGRGKLSPGLGTATDLLTRSDYRGRPLPFSSDKSTAAKPRYTWPEYLWSQSPIPVAEAAHDIYSTWREQGMSKPLADVLLKGIVVGTISGATGIHIGDEYANPKAKQQEALDGISQQKYGKPFEKLDTKERGEVFKEKTKQDLQKAKKGSPGVSQLRRFNMTQPIPARREGEDGVSYQARLLRLSRKVRENLDNVTSGDYWDLPANKQRQAVTNAVSSAARAA